MNLLLIDIGNTHLNWAMEQNGEFHYGGQAGSSEKEITRLFDTRLADITAERVLLANVAGRELSEIISVLAEKNWGIKTEDLISPKQACGITNAYDKPSDLGIDRWVAMVAAYDMINGAVCVADCGTAITIDVLDAAGLHLGGLILPGFGLMQQAILQRGANLQDKLITGLSPDAVQFGQSTGACLQQGSLLASRAAIEQALQIAEKQIGNPVPLLITGGDSQVIQAHLSIPVRQEPYLVLKGLALVAKSTELEMKV